MNFMLVSSALQYNGKHTLVQNTTFDNASDSRGHQGASTQRALTRLNLFSAPIGIVNWGALRISADVSNFAAMQDLNWYGKQSDAEGLTLGALAVIAPMIEKMKVVEIINQHLPVDAQAEYDHGTLLALMIAARLSSPLALSNIHEWAGKSGADVLWGVPVEKLNDDRLGRSLDALFSQRHSIMASLALHASKYFDIPLERLHYDPTHILFTGAYEDAEPREDFSEESVAINDNRGAAHITKGRATDDAAKGTRMVHAGLLSYIDELGVLPLFGHVIDGNQNGRTGIREQLSLITKLLKPQRFTMISDRGTFSVAHLLRLKKAKSFAICSVPWGDIKELFRQQQSDLNWSDASYLSIEQTRRRERNSLLPREHYELAEVSHEMTDDATGESIACRVMFVFSTADQKVVEQQRKKKIVRIQKELAQLQQSVAAGRYNTKISAIDKRVARAFGDGRMERFFTVDVVELTVSQLAKQPKPRRGCKQPTHRFEWSFDEAKLKDAQAEDGYSAIVTTVPAREKSCDETFSMFREQNLVEHANSQFKGPLAVRPIFLHSPHRVEALVFLLMIGLMIYFSIQRTYRANTEEEAPTKEHRMTAAKILTSFSNYTLIVERQSAGRVITPTRLTAQQRAILNRLQFPSPAQTLSRRLTPVPDS
jgi:transposase